MLFAVAVGQTGPHTKKEREKDLCQESIELACEVGLHVEENTHKVALNDIERCFVLVRNDCR